mgnify:CR=1 FL=1
MSTDVRHRYLDVTETAKLIRSALRADFQGCKFSVRCDRYADGSSVHVSWTDGPTERDVSSLVKPYEGSDFDGSIDMATDLSVYLRDGRVVGYATQGTERSMGTIPAHDDAVVDAELVRPLCSHVSCSRRISPTVDAAAAAFIEQRMSVPEGDRPHWAWRLLSQWDSRHDTLDDAFERMAR